MAGVHHFLATALFLLSLIITSSTFFHPANSKPKNGFSLRLIPRDAPESPLYPGNLTQLERIERMINFTKARADYLNITLSSHPNSNFNSNSNSTAQLDALTLSMARQSFFYMATIALGTPGFYVYLLMDTGGGLIWTQCKPCINCFKQGLPIYDPRKSSSYRKLPCSHPLCQGAGAVFQCVNDQCVYDVRYGGADGPVTKGIASVETFRNPPLIIDGLIFGCSNDNTNMPFPENGIISGLMGLSKKPDSLLSQLPDLTKRRFSYCLVPFTETIMRPFHLTFGEDIPIVPGVQNVPFATPAPGSYYYHLDLYDISVAGKQLDFPVDTFKPQPGGTLGFIIDTGSVFSVLDQNAHGQNVYLRVTKAFEDYYNGLALSKVVGPVPEGLELCYVYTPDFTQYASMTYHLQDENYQVDGQQVHLFNIDNGYFCVALMKAGGISTLGAWHQQNMRITYDLNANQLQFAPEKCQPS